MLRMGSLHFHRVELSKQLRRGAFRFRNPPYQSPFSLTPDSVHGTGSAAQTLRLWTSATEDLSQIRFRAAINWTVQAIKVPHQL